MSEPNDKPFSCSIDDCDMTFTNEDHLNFHRKKHELNLQLGIEQKGANFTADQTPTPTRFIRNCEEVGLFQELQNVNPFEDGFKRALEIKSSNGFLTIDTKKNQNSDGSLHTPTFTILEQNSTALNININNSNDKQKETSNTDIPMMSQKSIENAIDELTEVKSNDIKRKNNPRPNKLYKKHNDSNSECYEITLKLPTGKEVIMKSVDTKTTTTNNQSDVKQSLKTILDNKIIQKSFITNTNLIRADPLLIPNSVNILSGNIVIPQSLIPVQLINPLKKRRAVVTKEQIFFNHTKVLTPRMRRRKNPLENLLKKQTVTGVQHKPNCDILSKLGAECSLNCAQKLTETKAPIQTIIPNETTPRIINNTVEGNTSVSQSFVQKPDINCEENPHKGISLQEVEVSFDWKKPDRESNLCAARRYRSRQKKYQQLLVEQNTLLLKENKSLRDNLTKSAAELAKLKDMITKHMRTCTEMTGFDS